MPALTLAIAQMNPTVGDIAGNMKKIVAFHRQAASQQTDLVIFPELCLIGYPPEDLVLMPAFCKEAMSAARALAKVTAKGPAMVVGCPWKEGGKTYNAALLLAKGRIAHIQKKAMLPNYGVFDEKRIFAQGSAPKVVHWRGVKLGLLVCEDVWTAELAASLKRQGAAWLIAINASPFEAGKLAYRKKEMAKVLKKAKLPLVYVNMVGGQDDLVFDGGSFVMNASGKVTAQLPEFEEAFSVVKVDGTPHTAASPLSAEETVWQAMTLGLGDYVRKNGFKDVLLGLSGGIDSALVAAIAVDALGAKNVKGVLLPSPYTSHESVEDALAVAKNLGIATINLPIIEAMQSFEERLNPVFRSTGWMEDVAVGGNLQARLRGIMLMAMSNQSGALLLSTANKSELAVGYSTLYGDSCGAYMPLKDVYKTQVYALARWRNGHQPRHAEIRKTALIPPRCLTKAPSAELKPGQKDQDQLPPYDVLDAVLVRHIEGRQSAAEIAAKGYSRDVVENIIRMVRMAEYKRRQSPPGAKVSSMLFGRDRRYPLTNRFVQGVK